MKSSENHRLNLKFRGTPTKRSAAGSFLWWTRRLKTPVTNKSTKDISILQKSCVKHMWTTSCKCSIAQLIVVPLLLPLCCLEQNFICWTAKYNSYEKTADIFCLENWNKINKVIPKSYVRDKDGLCQFSPS